MRIHERNEGHTYFFFKGNAAASGEKFGFKDNPRAEAEYIYAETPKVLDFTRCCELVIEYENLSELDISGENGKLFTAINYIGSVGQLTFVNVTIDSALNDCDAEFIFGVGSYGELVKEKCLSDKLSSHYKLRFSAQPKAPTFVSMNSNFRAEQFHLKISKKFVDERSHHLSSSLHNMFDPERFSDSHILIFLLDTSIRSSRDGLATELT